MRMTYLERKEAINNRCVDCHKIIAPTEAKRCRRCFSVYNSGENCFYYKDGRSLINNNCLDCGVEISWNAKRCIRCCNTKQNNPRWLGGISFLPYPPEFNDELKEEIKRRDNYTCQRCFKKHKVLSVHHIDYNKWNCNKNNLITLGNECNAIVNGNRDYWYAYFKFLLEAVK